MNSYTAARISAMRSALLRQEDYERFLRMSPSEVVAQLQGTTYRDAINALQLRDLEDLETVDRTLARSMDETMRKLGRISSDDFHTVVDIFLRRNDAWNVKVITEAIAGGKDPLPLLERYRRPGTFDPMPLASAGSLPELIARARKRIPALRRANPTLGEMLDALSAIPIAANQKGTSDAFVGKLRPELRFLIDERNLILIFLRTRDGVPGSDIAKRLQRGGTIGMARLRDAAIAPTVPETIATLRGTHYAGIALHAQDTFLKLEYELHRETLRQITHHASRDPLSPAVAIRYIVEREQEIANLRLLLKGRRLGLTEGFVRAQLMSW
jgi:V/A-type H+-transporting ATPase subunit C